MGQCGDNARLLPLLESSLEYILHGRAVFLHFTRLKCEDVSTPARIVVALHPGLLKHLGYLVSP